MEAEQSIVFAIYGKPQTQGSTREVPIRAKGGGYATREDGRPVLRPIHQNDEELRPWRQAVAAAARGEYAGPLLDGPIVLRIQFLRPRPKSHYGSGRNSHLVRPSAPAFPTTRPDTLKLARAVEDALTGVLWRDDSQVVRHVLNKDWGDSYKTVVSVTVIDEHRKEPEGDDGATL